MQFGQFGARLSGEEREAANGGSLRGGYPDFRRSDDIEDRRRQKYSQNPNVEDPNYKQEWLHDGAPASPLAHEAGIASIKLDGLTKSQLQELSERALRQMRKAGSDLPLPDTVGPRSATMRALNNADHH
jgi:hypothetical protein